ncbi:MAG: hypothetical protein R3C99_01350 [Pirellulaceae bacterium]|nr:hypothetical protein [Planctomycetales bacterium]MCA9221210.1 hypothetical protein [Planctomycetales bacterium]MCA9225723.1 hypothetical protein [Planctomycetales bacterium]
MLDFEVQRCGRRCHKSDREFRPGETYFSVLVRDGAEIVRHDYSAEAWEGPPEDAIGWWKSTVLDTNQKGPSWAPNDVIRDYFRQLEEDDDRADLRYVLGLLMVRRRLMRLDNSEHDEAGHEFLVMTCTQEGIEHRVLVCTPTPERVQEIQEELGKLLFADA